mmetsp:Transcript_13111/g.39908  ORF Transcript_13111/g.39908 Transcript_13111/m.39908 type:complete len:185 (+) Transcript_13111:1267-1821(+)
MLRLAKALNHAQVCFRFVPQRGWIKVRQIRFLLCGLHPPWCLLPRPYSSAVLPCRADFSLLLWDVFLLLLRVRGDLRGAAFDFAAARPNTVLSVSPRCPLLFHASLMKWWMFPELRFETCEPSWRRHGPILPPPGAPRQQHRCRTVCLPAVPPLSCSLGHPHLIMTCQVSVTVYRARVIAIHDL